ncbi:hypothetical protein L198_08143 [Cryptococcus wingfieldii CBS 7118]|uniref:F-box domain-containing protein n=1 Tax=Cryptococcus wingfieldii CBS 7118 TaxID=1295528 RepID=A0A1E3HIY4_9TREE|nr:hypothetical protein L198_08143 [Cryptococcus wingfieldii CBS 7118]ODN75686.1 hypothetical protein L198_08143 [Cryptococcus wingfieldii CBS 7118]
MSPQPPLFTQDAYSDVLIGIFDCLTLKEVVSFIRVNKHVHNVFRTSSRLQLSHTQRLFSVPPSTFRQGATPADSLAALKERQQRMDDFDPSSIISIQQDRYHELVALENGLLVFHSEVGRETAGETCFDESSEGWDVYRVDRGASDIDSLNRGAVRDQGLWHWKTRTSAEFYHIEMCGEDNLVALIFRPMKSQSYSTNLSLRVEFYCALPPLGTPAPIDGFLDPIPHPDAPIPFIELIFPVEYAKAAADLTFGPGGQLAVLMNDRDSEKTIFGGVWDWKKGVCLGSIPIAEHQIISTVSPCGPFAFTASTRPVPASVEPGLYDKALCDFGPPPPDDFPEELKGFVQCSFDAHILLPPSLGFPPVKPDPANDYEYAQTYPTMGCSWYMSDIPSAIPVVRFDLPIEDLLPHTLAMAYEPESFNILQLRYSPSIHESDTLGIFTWGLDDMSNVADLSSLLDRASEFAFRMMVAEMPRMKKEDVLRLVDLASFETGARTAIVAKAAKALVLMRYHGRLTEGGVWSPSGSGRGVMPQEGSEEMDEADDSSETFVDTTAGKDFVRFLESRYYGRQPRTNSKLDIRSPDTVSPLQPISTFDSPSHDPDQAPLLPQDLHQVADGSPSLAAIPSLPYKEWMSANHLRLGIDFTLSAMYGTREVRIVPAPRENMLDVFDGEEGEGGEEGEMRGKLKYVLSLSDYNESSLPDGVWAKRRIAGARRRELGAFKALLGSITDTDDPVAIDACRDRIRHKLSGFIHLLAQVDSCLEVEREKMLSKIVELDDTLGDDEDLVDMDVVRMFEAQKRNVILLGGRRAEVEERFQSFKNLLVEFEATGVRVDVEECDAQASRMEAGDSTTLESEFELSMEDQSG